MLVMGSCPPPMQAEYLLTSDTNVVSISFEWSPADSSVCVGPVELSTQPNALHFGEAEIYQKDMSDSPLISLSIHPIVKPHTAPYWCTERTHKPCINQLISSYKQ